ncbi:hypothetical protein M406DRAFT_333411 [Cryphonectria parasitica EP155]|uniref:Uncharacterized protein n=1 Tax=Cryphonectria parasitica (strain ATCC 38755 / EP155) TaxID=660469 RepID=A0A9P5CJT7_CRYP1|nr:uncharacterized protein M406DRAFT_333411 [Cryphonectria parasitica EP155]KAF3761343.1 hypothetical protein M406DRAFT_333411 [Cryphonectria parasitica EP155]
MTCTNISNMVENSTSEQHEQQAVEMQKSNCNLKSSPFQTVVVPLQEITLLGEATATEDVEAGAEHHAKTTPDKSPAAGESSTSMRGSESNSSDAVCRCGTVDPHHKSRPNTLWSNAEALARLENHDGQSRKTEIKSIDKQKWKAFRKRMKHLKEDIKAIDKRKLKAFHKHIEQLKKESKRK